MIKFKTFLDEKGRCWPGHKPVPGKKPYSPGSCKKEEAEETNEDLRQWFKQKWVRMDTKGNIKGQCAREKGEGKPKCLPSSKAHSLGKEGRAKAAQRKRREDPNPERRGKAINVKTEELDLNYIGVEDLMEAENLLEKNKPTSPEKWVKAKSAAKSKFAVYPSAYANAWAAKKYKSMGGGWRSTKEEFELDESDFYEDYIAEEMFDEIEYVVNGIAEENNMDAEIFWENLEDVTDEELFESAAWRRKEGKNPSGGLNRKGIMSYRRENPGSKLKMAVTGKVKPGSKAAKRRKSFCARMSGMKGPMKKPNGKPTRKALALRKWRCRS